MTGTFWPRKTLQIQTGTGPIRSDSMISDETLLLDYQQGSQAAFAELFARYRDPLYGFFCRRLLSRERAEDLTQDTFVAVIRAIGRYKPRSSVRTYLYGIALKILAAERRKKLRPESPLDVVGSGSPGEIEATLAVRRALGLIEPVEQEILMLREYEQLSYGEIAELLSIPVNTVRSRLFRSRMALKSHSELIRARGVRQENEKCQ